MVEYLVSGVTGGSAILTGDLRKGGVPAVDDGLLSVTVGLLGSLRTTQVSVQGLVEVTAALSGGLLDSFPFLGDQVVEVEGGFDLVWASHDILFGTAELTGHLRLGNSANDGQPASVFGEVDAVAALTGGLIVNLAVADDSSLVVAPLLSQGYNFSDEGGSTLLEVTPVLEPSDPFLIPDAPRSPPMVLLDGTNPLARPSSDSALNPSGAFSVSVTFDPEVAQPGVSCVVVAKHNLTDSQAGWLLEWDASTGIATFTAYGDATGTISVSRPTSSAVRVRTRLTATVSAGGDVQIYLNGASDQGSLSTAGSWSAPNASTEPFSVGCDEPSNDGTNRMKGAVYDVAVWDVELSSGQVAGLIPTGVMPSALTGDLVAHFASEDIQATPVSGLFAAWIDSVGSLALSPLDPASFERIVVYSALSGTGPTQPPLRPAQRHDALTLLDQILDIDPDPALATTHRLDLSLSWRLWSSGSLTPQILPPFRSYRNDITITVVLSRVSGSTDVVILRFYGIRFEFNSSTGVRVIDGDDSGGSTNRLITYDSLGLQNGRVEPTSSVVPNSSVVIYTLRWNAYAEELDLFVSGIRVATRTVQTGQSAFSQEAGLICADLADFRFVEVFPACLTDEQIQQSLLGFMPSGYATPWVSSFNRFHATPFAVVDRVHRPFRDDQALELVLPPSSATVASGVLVYRTGGGIEQSTVTIELPKSGGGLMSYSDNGAGVFVADAGAQPVASSFISYTGTAATGTVSLLAQPADGDTVSLVSRDGTVMRVFEFDSGSSVTGGNVPVTIGSDRDETAQNLRDAINVIGLLRITASGSAGTVALAHDDPGVPVDALISVSGANLSSINFASGVEPGAWSITITGGGLEFATDADRRGLAAYTWVSAGENPVAALIPFDKIEQLLTQHYLTLWIDASFGYVDAPYIVKDGFDEDEIDGGGEVFIDPQPTVVNVTADATHVVTATANAGPTNAGDVITWWEIELVSSNEELILVADYFQPNLFSTNRNHLDTFQIVDGQNLNERRIRFVIQAVSDASQIWKSLFFRMIGENFDNDPPTIVNVPTTDSGGDFDVGDLLTSEERAALVLARRARVATPIDPQSAESRYKTTKVFSGSSGYELGLMAVLEDFYSVGTDYLTHVVVSQDIGFLDRIAVRFYGPGFEWAWWVIAYANALADPDLEMFEGQRLVIPPRTAVQRFLNRQPVTTLTTSE